AEEASAPWEVTPSLITASSGAVPTDAVALTVMVWAAVADASEASARATERVDVTAATATTPATTMATRATQPPRFSMPSLLGRRATNRPSHGSHAGVPAPCDGRRERAAPRIGAGPVAQPG